MAGIDGGLSPLAESAHHLANHLVSGQKAAEGMTGALFRSALALNGISKALSFVGSMVAQTKIGGAFVKAMSAESLNLTALEEKRKKAKGEEIKLIEDQIEFAKKLHGWGAAQIGLGSLTLAAATNLWLKQRQFGQDLIEANSSFEHRNELLKQTLVTQAQLGVNFHKATEAARALVHYGLDTSDTYNDNVKLVAQMEQGLGVSVNASAQLATIVERQLKGSFKDVADTIASIVENTALAGDEAAKLANSIGTAMGRLRPGLSAAGLPEVLRLVGRYEGALKEVGGQAGGFEHLLTGLTRPEGMTGAGVLGGISPEFLATARGVQTVIDRFAKYGNMLVGQSQGIERQFRLQILAEQFQISTDQASQMMMAVKRANEAQYASISLHDRWRNQMHATNQGIDRLANSLLGLLQNALLPLVNFIAGITNTIADMVEGLLSNKDVIDVSFWVINTGLAALGIGLGKLVGTILSYVGKLSGFSGFSGLARFGLGLASAPVLAPSLVLGALAYIGYKLSQIYEVEKKSLEEAQKANQVDIAKYNELQDKTEEKIYRIARYGGSDDEMEKQVGLLMQHIRVENEGKADILKAKIAEAEAIVANIQDRAKTSLALSGVLDREGIDQGENQLVEWARKTHAIAEEAKKVDEKRLQWQKEQAQEDEKRDAKLMLYNLNLTPIIKDWSTGFSPIF